MENNVGEDIHGSKPGTDSNLSAHIASYEMLRMNDLLHHRVLSWSKMGTSVTKKNIRKTSQNELSIARGYFFMNFQCY